MSEPLLSIHDLTISLQEEGGERILLKRFNLKVDPFKIVALVGLSGSGKTTVALSVLRLLSEVFEIEEGQILFQKANLLSLGPQEMRRLRGKAMGMVFQEPLNAFNPVFPVGFQIGEVLRVHTSLSYQKIRTRIIQLLEMVGIPDPPRVMQSFPHQLSGGLRQRAMIAQAIAAGPSLIIADEPTSNLDVTLQAHIMDLFRHLKETLKISILLITHDLGVVSHLADEVAVLSEGEIIESGPTSEILSHPRQAFTQELLGTFLG